jgi:hypothetical protein
VFATGFFKTGLEHATLQRPTVSESIQFFGSGIAICVGFS